MVIIASVMSKFVSIWKIGVTHLNHDQKLAHLKMYDDVRTMNGAKLQSGVTDKKIIDDIPVSVSDGNGRKHIVTL